MEHRAVGTVAQPGSKPSRTRPAGAWPLGPLIRPGPVGDSRSLVRRFRPQVRCQTPEIIMAARCHASQRGEFATPRRGRSSPWALAARFPYRHVRVQGSRHRGAGRIGPRNVGNPAGRPGSADPHPPERARCAMQNASRPRIGRRGQAGAGHLITAARGDAGRSGRCRSARRCPRWPAPRGRS